MDSSSQAGGFEADGSWREGVQSLEPFCFKVLTDPLPLTEQWNLEL